MKPGRTSLTVADLVGAYADQQPGATTSHRAAKPDRAAGADRSEFCFGRISLAPLTMTEAQNWIIERAAAETPGLVVTSNIHHLLLAATDPRFGAVVEHCDLNVADGWPLVAASRLLGPPLPQRVGGIDLVHAVLHTAERMRIAILGGPPGSAARLAERVAHAHDVVLVDPLPAGRWNRTDGLRRLGTALVDAHANLTLLGMGAPQQELLGDALRPAAAGPIICCGAAIEVLAGMRARAPRLMQRTGLEWAFRLGLEPRRLAGRYFKAGSSFLLVLAEERARRDGDLSAGIASTVQSYGTDADQVPPS